MSPPYSRKSGRTVEPHNVYLVPMWANVHEFVADTMVVYMPGSHALALVGFVGAFTTMYEGAIGGGESIPSCACWLRPGR